MKQSLNCKKKSQIMSNSTLLDQCQQFWLAHYRHKFCMTPGHKEDPEEMQENGRCQWQTCHFSHPLQHKKFHSF